jgi:hypothetical protein
MAAVGRDPNRAGGEGDSVPVAAFLREPREPHPAAMPGSGARGVPVPVAVDRGPDAVGECLLADLGPPHLAGVRVHALSVLDLVPPFPQPGQRRLPGLLAGGEITGDVLPQGAHCPVPRMSAATKLPPDHRRLLRRAIQSELECLHGPALGDLEPSHGGGRFHSRPASLSTTPASACGRHDAGRTRPPQHPAPGRPAPIEAGTETGEHLDPVPQQVVIHPPSPTTASLRPCAAGTDSTSSVFTPAESVAVLDYHGGHLRVGQQPAHLRTCPAHPGPDLCPHDLPARARSPHRQPGHLPIRVRLLVTTKHPRIQPVRRTSGPGRRFRGHQHSGLVHPHRRHRQPPPSQPQARHLENARAACAYSDEFTQPVYRTRTRVRTL